MALGDYGKTTYVNGGTPAINATNLNNNETKTAQIDLALKHLEIDGTTLSYTDGVLTEVLENVNSVNYQRTTLSYTDSVLTGVNVKRYDTDGTTIIQEWNETLTYTDSILTGVSKVEV